MAIEANLAELVAQLDHPNEETASEAGIALSELLESGELTAMDVFPAVDQILTAYQTRRDDLLAAEQQAGSAWIWDEDYATVRYEAELLIDLIGYMPTPESDAILRAALDYRDPLLQFWAVLGLMRQDKSVPQPTIDVLAANPLTRNRLYHLLEEAEEAERFPARYRTQQAFALSDMIEWLTFPTELGREPDEIEQMQVVTKDLGAPYGQADYYIFRFRMRPPHWAAESGWMSGVSGPFLHSEQPTPHAHGHTFSTFESWGETPPEQLVADIQDLFDNQLGDDDDE